MYTMFLVMSAYKHLYIKQTYVVRSQKNRLNETILFEYPGIHIHKLKGKMIF